MAMAFFNRYFPPLAMKFETGVIRFPFITDLDKIWLPLVGYGMILAISYLIFFIVERYKLLSQTTTLPSLIYVLLTGGVMMKFGFDALLISVLVAVLAVGRLQMAINEPKSNKALYDFGFLITLSVVVYPKFILLLAWAFGVLFFSGRSTLKDIMALWLGMLTPPLFVGFYYFWNDGLEKLPSLFMNNLQEGEFIHHLPLPEFIRLGILLFILLAALYRLSQKYPVLVVCQRRGILSLLSMLVFLSLTFLVIPGNYYDFMYMFAMPLSFLYAYYFLNTRKALFNNLMFILLLTASVLTWIVL